MELRLGGPDDLEPWSRTVVAQGRAMTSSPLIRAEFAEDLHDARADALAAALRCHDEGLREQHAAQRAARVQDREGGEAERFGAVERERETRLTSCVPQPARAPPRHALLFMRLPFRPLVSYHSGPDRRTRRQ